MSESTFLTRLGYGHAVPAVALLLAGSIASAQKADTGRPGKSVGKNVTPDGVLLQRGKDASAWESVKPEQPVHDGDLLVALAPTTLESGNKAVRLTLLGNAVPLSPSPVLESAVRVHANPKVDLDFTLDRGRVTLTSQKPTGAARVRVRFHDQDWEIHLNGRDAKVGLELYGRWPRGIAFRRQPREGEAPSADVYLVAMNGQADLRLGSRQFALGAPPGPALFHWDSIAGAAPGPQRLAKLPEWSDPAVDRTADAKKLQAAFEQLRTRLVNQPVENALQQPLVESANPSERQLGVYGLAAIDDLPRLFSALAHEKHADVRQAAVVALRHWIGRGAGQDQKLFDTLVQHAKFPAGQAEIVLQLLHSFGDRDLARPETYETLIAYLRHDKLAIRELAKWHLYRLVPAGKGIAYDAAGSEASRQKAFQAWQKLIPEGQLPPAPKQK